MMGNTTVGGCVWFLGRSSPHLPHWRGWGAAGSGQDPRIFIPECHRPSARSLGAAGDGQLGASERQYWPGAHRDLAGEGVQLESEEMPVGRCLCLWGGSPEGWYPQQKPQAIPHRALARPERPDLQLSPPLLPATWSRLISLRSILSFEIGPSLPRGVSGSNMTCLGQEVKLQTLASSGHTDLPCPGW